MLWTSTSLFCVPCPCQWHRCTRWRAWRLVWRAPSATPPCRACRARASAAARTTRYALERRGDDGLPRIDERVTLDSIAQQEYRKAVMCYDYDYDKTVPRQPCPRRRRPMTTVHTGGVSAFGFRTTLRISHHACD
eukprot:7378754-Prymnesium_polylepis.1